MSAECSKKVIDQLGFKYNNIKTCVESSFTGVGDYYNKENFLMEKEIEYRREVGIYMFPSLTVNNQTIRGDWEVSEINTAICAGFD